MTNYNHFIGWSSNNFSYLQLIVPLETNIQLITRFKHILHVFVRIVEKPVHSLCRVPTPNRPAAFRGAVRDCPAAQRRDHPDTGVSIMISIVVIISIIIGSVVITIQ